MDNNTEKLIAFITLNPNSNKEALTVGTGFKGLHLFNLLKKSLADGLIESKGEGDDTIYIVCEKQDENSAEQPSQEQQEIEDKEEITDQQVNETPTGDEENTTILNEVKEESQAPAVKKSFVRNNTQYIFNEKVLGKGPLVLAVVSKYVEDNPTTTFEQLKEIFPDTLMKRFGVFATEEKAKELSGKVNRYFLKSEQLIKLEDAMIAVCNQWTSALLVPFLELADKLGYTIAEKQD
jgi:hypothetical protein